MSKEVEFSNRNRFIELGLMIATLRKMQAISQEKLAERAKISRSHLSSIKAPNIVRPLSLEVLYNIADALGVRSAPTSPARCSGTRPEISAKASLGWRWASVELCAIGAHPR